MLPDEVAGEVIIRAAAKDKLHFIAKCESIQIFKVKRLALARIRTLYIRNLNDPGWNLVQRPLPAGLEQNRVAAVQQALH